METKYTTDGKKVIIVGNLNSQEKIVQEIFVSSNGQEIPSGENFVVKSLHDEPVVSWKGYYQKKAEQMEDAFKKSIPIRESEINEKRKKLDEISGQLKDRLKWAAGALKEVKPEAFDFLVKFFGNEFTHAVIKDYGSYKIIPFDDVFVYSDGWREREYEALKLLTLFGKSEGKFDYRINRYSDGSGSNQELLLFCSYEESVDHLTQKINDLENYSVEILKLAKEHNIVLDTEKLTAYHELQKRSISNEIKSLEEKLSDWRDKLNNYQY